MKTFCRLVAIAAVISPGVFAAEVPVVRSCDVVVVGGASAAVSAAVSAKEAGAEVFLIAPRPYLGEDIAGTMRLVREEGDDIRSHIFRRFFDPASVDAKGLGYSYTTDIKPNAKTHSDPKGDCLNDGLVGRMANDSVQYDGDVTITADLGGVKKIANVRLDTYVRWPPDRPNVKNNGAITHSVSFSTSADGKAWSSPVEVNDPDQAGSDVISFSVSLAAECRYVRLVCVKDVTCPRQLLAELVIYPVIDNPHAFAKRTTPFTVKRTLDKALLAANVPYLTGSVVCDVVKDAGGAFAGVVMANRSGRQIVLAKTLIDATPRAFAARLAGGRTKEFQEGVYPFHRIVVAGEEPKGEGVKARVLSGPFVVSVNNGLKHEKFPSVIEARIWDCEIMIPMKDGSARSFAAAEQIARDRTFVPTLVDAANKMTLAMPDRFICKASCDFWRGADALNIAALEPEGTKGVYVLGARAGLSDDAMKEMMKVGNCLMAGARAGLAAAKEAKMLPKRGGRLVGAVLGEAISGVLGEHHGVLPQYLTTAKSKVELDDKLPVLAACDTVVVGAGTGGAPAGIAAARHGACTIVCEYLYVEGGVQTDGLIGKYYFGNRVGFTREVDAGVRQTGSVFPMAKSEWYRREQRKAGCEIWFGAFANGIVVKDGRVAGVVVVMDDGTRGVVKCRNAIDATGNAELPAMAGEETEFITDDELSVQGAGQAQRLLGSMMANSDIGFVDDTDAADLFYFALRSRLSLPENTWDQAQIVNSRERRRMIGAFYMRAQDVVNGRTYPDVVLRTRSNFDSHGQTRDAMFFIQDPGHKPMFVNLPYRCLLPKKLEGLLVTGLGVSAHRDAMPILRMQPDIQNQGYAAGTAAAMAVKDGVDVRNIDIKALQKHLFEKKILRGEDLVAEDNFPLPDEVFDIATAECADDYKGFPVLMTDPARALPRLRAAYHAAEGESKFVYAHVLAMMGVADGEKRLLAKFEAMPWDKGWNFRGMGQFNRSVSWVDSYAIALGRCRSKAAVPALIAKANELTDKSRYSHFRAIALAFEGIGDRAAIPVLADILRRDGIAGHWQEMSANPPVIPGYQNPLGDRERTLSLREICIARALFRLGDTSDGLGRRILEAYAQDPRRAYAKHAQLVLDGKDRR